MTIITKYIKSPFWMVQAKYIALNKPFSLLLIALIWGVFNTPALYGQSALNKIVIDAGHGGKDPGAAGRYSREKDIALAIALKTGKLLKEKYPKIEIIYTRKTDVFIPLKERAEIANRNKADLFLSIHCNSNRSSQPHGSETYVMGLHKSEANLNVAKKENAAILLEDDYQTQYDGFDPTSDESHIIFNFFQNSFLSQNLDIASKIQNQFTVTTPLKDRGVKQAGFWVLYKTTMPGVLIETGFLSNVKEEKLLNSKSGQLKISTAIAEAVSEYKIEHDTREEEKLRHKHPTDTNTIAAVKTQKPKQQTAQKEEEIQAAKKTAASTSPSQTKTKPQKELPIYKVQFISLSSQKKINGKKFDKLNNIDSYKYKGMYRYTSGKTQSFEEALKIQQEVRKAGFIDAFIVAFFNGERITVKEAKKITQK